MVRRKSGTEIKINALKCELVHFDKENKKRQCGLNSTIPKDVQEQTVYMDTDIENGRRVERD